MPRSVVGQDYSKRTGKFGDEDTRYLADRAALSAQLGPQELWSIADHWGLYCGTQTLGRTLAFVNAIEATLRVPGDVVEFGSWQGSTLLLFAKLLALYDPHGVKVVHGFSRWDTGFTPAEWQSEDNLEAAETYRGTCNGEKARLETFVALHGLRGAVELYDGDVEATWPAWQAALPARRLSLVLLDMDLYRPTAIALDGLHERLNPGALVLFDQAQHIDWPGEGQAAQEFLDAHPNAYDVLTVPHARQPELMLVRR